MILDIRPTQTNSISNRSPKDLLSGKTSMYEQTQRRGHPNHG